MTRKIWFAICLALTVGLHVHMHMKGTAGNYPLLEPLVIAWTAFMLPAALPVAMIERYVFHLEPWADENTALTGWCLILTASAIWFFPTARLTRWFGAFDAFKEGLWLRVHTRLRLPKWMRHPSLVRGAASALDALNKRLFGRQKTGGWA